MKLNLELDGRRQELRVLRRGDRIRLRFEDGREIEARLLVDPGGDGAFELELGHARLHAVGHAAGPEERQLWLNGRSFDYRRVSRQGGSAGPSVESSLSVSIPAVVNEILVEPGQAVREGQKLLLLESMKMVLPIIAPRDGIVESIDCRVGESVAPAVPLLRLVEEAGGEGAGGET